MPHEAAIFSGYPCASRAAQGGVSVGIGKTSGARGGVRLSVGDWHLFCMLTAEVQFMFNRGGRKLRKLYSFFLVIMAAVLVIAGCAEGEQTSGDAPEGSGSDGGSEGAETSGDSALSGEVVTILTGGTSGVYFPLGNALAKIYDEQLGAQASSQTTGASAENASKIAQQNAEIAFAMADTVADAYNGEETFEDVGALDNLRAVGALYSNIMQIVVPQDSGIESVTDLAGKRVAVGAPGSGTEIMAKRVLAAAGITYDDINEDYLSFKEGVEGIQNGVIDAAFLVSGIPNAGIMELTTTDDVTLLPVSEEIVDELQSVFPAHFSEVIPAGTYDGIDEEIETAGVKNVLITHADLSDEIVYAMTKTFYENLEALGDAHNSAKLINLEEATEGLPLPLHPGAEAYFEEEGVLN